MTPDRHTAPDGLRYLPVYTLRRVPDPWCWQRPSFWACIVFVGVWVWILRRLWA